MTALGRVIEAHLISAESHAAQRQRGAITMQTAFSIENVSSSASFNPPPVSEGGGSSLSVSWRIRIPGSDGGV